MRERDRGRTRRQPCSLGDRGSREPAGTMFTWRQEDTARPGVCTLNKNLPRMKSLGHQQTGAPTNGRESSSRRKMISEGKLDARKGVKRTGNGKYVPKCKKIIIIIFKTKQNSTLRMTICSDNHDILMVHKCQKNKND